MQVQRLRHEIIEKIAATDKVSFEWNICRVKNKIRSLSLRQRVDIVEYLCRKCTNTISGKWSRWSIAILPKEYLAYAHIPRKLSHLQWSYSGTTSSSVAKWLIMFQRIQMRWTYPASILFSFTILTTIGTIVFPTIINSCYFRLWKFITDYRLVQDSDDDIRSNRYSAVPHNNCRPGKVLQNR